MKPYIIRHGNTYCNEKKLYCGREDVSLSEGGILNLRDLKEKFYYPLSEVYFTSGAKRANETLKILFNNVHFESIKDFWEYDFGDFEMKSYDMLKENEEYIKWITDNEGKVSCPNGESKIEYRKRIKNTFNMFIKKCFTENRNEAILVCHGGTIGTILEIFYDDSKNFYEHQPNCGRGYKINFLLHILNYSI